MRKNALLQRNIRVKLQSENSEFEVFRIMLDHPVVKYFNFGKIGEVLS